MNATLGSSVHHLIQWVIHIGTGVDEFIRFAHPLLGGGGLLYFLIIDNESFITSSVNVVVNWDLVNKVSVCSIIHTTYGVQDGFIVIFHGS